jgi:hypothetical protein
MKTLEDAVPGDVFIVWWCPNCNLHFNNWEGDETVYCPACQITFNWDQVNASQRNERL